MMISLGAAVAAHQRRVLVCRSLFLVQTSSSSSWTCRCRTSGSSICISSVFTSRSNSNSSIINNSSKQQPSTMIVPTLATRRRNQIITMIPPPPPPPQQIHGLIQQQQQQRPQIVTATAAATTEVTFSLRASTVPKDTSSMNAILEDWWNACKTISPGAAAAVAHPMEMLAWVDKQQRRQQQQHHHQHRVAVNANTQTYTLLMDGALAFFAKNNSKTRRLHRNGNPENDKKQKKHNNNNAYSFVSSLLERMLQESNIDVNNNKNANIVAVVAPNVMHFHKVMTAAVKQDHKNIVAAEEWLVRLLNLYRAQLLQLQEQEQQQGDHDQHQHQQQDHDDHQHPLSLLAPTVDSFAIVIAAWSKIGFPTRAEYILNQLVHCHAEFAAQGLDLQPRREHYESCINAWIRASYFATRKQQARQRLENRNRGGNHKDDKITATAAAAAGMAKIAGHRTEALVLQMMELHQQQQQQYDIKPNVHSLFKVLTCWVQAQTSPPASSHNENHTTTTTTITSNNNVMAAQRATAILKLMLEMQLEEAQDDKQGKSSSSNEDKNLRHKQEQDRIIANAYVRVIQAWSSCCCYRSSNNNNPSLLPGAAGTAAGAAATASIEMVEMLLQQLQDRMATTATTGAVSTKAWQKACTHAIAAWGRVIATAAGADKNGAHAKNVALERAQAIFDGFLSSQQKQHHCLATTSKTNDMDVYHRRDDDGNDDDDDDDCLVNMYNELLHVYGRVGDSARAEALLRRMQQQPQQQQQRDSSKMPKPNAQSFNWVILAVRRNKHLSREQKEQALQTLEKNHHHHAKHHHRGVK